MDWRYYLSDFVTVDDDGAVIAIPRIGSEVGVLGYSWCADIDPLIWLVLASPETHATLVAEGWEELDCG